MAKLVRITDVRVGQIFKRRSDVNCKYWVIEDVGVKSKNCGDFGYFEEKCDTSHLCRFHDKNMDYDSSDYITFFGDTDLIGKIGITHEIQDGRLVEIERTDEFQVDDVVINTSQETKGLVLKEINGRLLISHEDLDRYTQTGMYGNSIYSKSVLKRIGTLGVDWEMVNSKVGDK